MGFGAELKQHAVVASTYLHDRISRLEDYLILRMNGEGVIRLVFIMFLFSRNMQ